MHILHFIKNSASGLLKKNRPPSRSISGNVRELAFSIYVSQQQKIRYIININLEKNVGDFVINQRNTCKLEIFS